MKSLLRSLLMGMAVALLGLWMNPICSAYAQPTEEARLLEAYQSGAIIRLHILAQDDTPQAQATKLAVRDAILAAFSLDLQGEDADALFALLQERTEDMRRVAEETALGLGFSGEVTAEVGVLSLPEKRYGQVVLPQGEYRGLRITLGKGAGQNWWCVLFPSLCLAVADEAPWQVQPAASSGEDAPETIVWDTERIAAHWLLWPGKE